MLSSFLSNCTVGKKLGNCPKFLSPAFLIVLFFALFAGTFKATAQNFFHEQSDYGIAVGVDYDIPGRNLSDTYKSGLNYNAGFFKYLNKFTVGLGVSYRQFGAKQSTFSDDDGSGNPSVTHISPFSSFAIYGSGVYNILPGQQNKLYIGINVGSYYTITNYSYTDIFGYNYESNNEEELYFAPKLGIACALNDNWDIDFHAAYNFFTKGFSAGYNTYDGATSTSYPLYSSITGGVSLVYKF